MFKHYVIKNRGDSGLRNEVFRGIKYNLRYIFIAVKITYRLQCSGRGRATLNKLEISVGRSSEMVAHILREVVWLMSQSEQHGNSNLLDLQTSVMPYILQRNFRLYRSHEIPIAVVFYSDMKPQASEKEENGSEDREKISRAINMIVIPSAKDEIFAPEFFAYSENKSRLLVKTEHTVP